jgi:hypothetical protein
LSKQLKWKNQEKKEELANKSLNPYGKAVYLMVDRFILLLSKKVITILQLNKIGRNLLMPPI